MKTLTAIDISISVFHHIVWHGALEVREAWRLDRQYLKIKRKKGQNFLSAYHMTITQ